MKSTLLILLLSLFFIPGLIQSQESEPNNSDGEANIIKIDTLNSGSIDAADGFDWFRFTLDTAAIVQFSFTKSGDAEFLAGIRDGINSSWGIANWILFSTDTTGILEAQLLKGEYYLVIDHRSGGMSNYEFQGTLQIPAFGEDQEPNDSIAEADSTFLGETRGGLVGYWKNGFGLERDDYFKIEVLEDGLLAFDISMSGEGQLEASIHDSTGVRLGFIRRNVSNGTADLDEKVKKGAHYLKLHSYLSSDWINYQFTSSLTPAPQAGFDFVQVDTRVSFSNQSTGAQNNDWSFGDGEESEQINPVHVYDPGVYETCLYLWAPAGRDTSCQMIVVKGIASVYPNSGGNTGYATIQVFGGGLDTASTIRFLDQGGVILQEDTTLLVAANALEATLDLRGMPTGTFDVEVENEIGQKFLLDKAFTIEEGTLPDPWVELSGRNRILFNIKSNYSLKIGNRGNVDANAVPVWLAISEDEDLEVEFTGLQFITTEGDSVALDTTLEHDYFLTDEIFEENFNARVYSFIIPTIAANSTEEIPIRIKSPGDLKIRAWTNEPLFLTDPGQNRLVDDKLKSCLIALFTGGYTSAIPTMTNDQILCVISGFEKDVTNLNSNTIKLAVRGLDGYFPEFNKSSAKITIGMVKIIAKTMRDCDIDPIGQDIGTAVTKVLVSHLMITEQELKDCLCSNVQTPARQEVECERCGTFCPSNINDRQITAVSSFDPNEKNGPSGYTEENYISLRPTIPYTIHFENVDTATAPAHTVRVLDTLDGSKFDLNSFQFGSFSIGDSSGVFEKGVFEVSAFQELNHLDVTARVQGFFDPGSGIVEWVFQSLDPAELREIEDPDLGFLPPNVTNPEGQGSVSFTIGLRDDVQHREVINNKALIYFDANEPIITDVSSVSFDLEAPESEVQMLDEETTEEMITVQWGGNDDASGLRFYDVFVAENDGSYQRWLSRTSQTSAQLEVIPGSNYKLFSVAVDSVGNVESIPAFPDAETSVTTAVHDVHQKNSIQFHPNPAGTHLDIIQEKKIASSVEIYNLRGSLVYKYELDSMHNKILLNTYSPGIYVLRFINDLQQTITIRKLTIHPN